MIKHVVVALLCWCASAAAIEKPISDIRLYDAAAPENVIRVKTARVVYADYRLIINDYPEAQALAEKFKGNAGAIKTAIDNWILENAGYMARTQILNPIASELHEPIAADFSNIILAYRPEGYRRGMVFKTGKRLLDGKGFGSPDPRPGTNTNGLMSLDEALSEVVKEQMVHAVGQQSGGKFTTVRSLAVIDWGFDMKLPEGGTSRAGAVLRQPHTREYWNFNSNLPEADAVAVELELRKYGLTSTGLSTTLREQARHGYDLINIQGKVLPEGPAVVDFGTIIRVPPGHRFERPLAVRFRRMYEPLADNPVWASRNILTPAMRVSEPIFVQAALDEQAIPAELFGVVDEAHPFPEFDRVRTAASTVVEGYRKTGARENVAAFITGMRGSLKLSKAECVAALTDPAF